MARFIIRRIAYSIPVLLLVSVIAFFFSTIAPGDIVEEHIAIEHDLIHSSSSYQQRQQAYQKMASKLDRDIPEFYFVIQPASYPDTLYKILKKDERQAARTLIRTYGCWPEIQDYLEEARSLVYYDDRQLPDSVRSSVRRIKQDGEYLLLTSDPQRIKFLLTGMSQTSTSLPGDLKMKVDEISRQWTRIEDAEAGFKSFLPSISWYGFRNQFHRWLGRTVTGNFGTSLIDGRSVSTKISEAVRWTLRLNVTTILLAFLIAIPLGVKAASKKDGWFDTLTSGVLFAFFAIPSFWLATLLVVFFTTPEYGAWTDLFPTTGIGTYKLESGFARRMGVLAEHLFLPVLCLLLGTLAYLTRQMRGGMLRELRKDYIKMAYAKGLPQRKILWGHAFKNALFPMLTIVGSAIPATISGSVIIEVIFGIPGMGQLMFSSILRQDWPVVFTMILIAAVLTVIGYLVSDLLYYLADPRVRLKSKR